MSSFLLGLATLTIVIVFIIYITVSVFLWIVRILCDMLVSVFGEKERNDESNI